MKLFAVFVNASVHLLTITVIPCSLQNMAVAQKTMLSSNMDAWFTVHLRCNELQYAMKARK
jgi:hypothetical protein